MVKTMQFSQEEIELAKRLRAHGLTWEPRAGHYVYDETGFCPHESPFQDKVFFILNYKYFMKVVGGVDRFKEIMIWLPTWHDSRQILRSLQVSDSRIAAYLEQHKAIENGCERKALFELIAGCLQPATAAT